MFSLRNKKNIMWIPPLICSYAYTLYGGVLYVHFSCARKVKGFSLYDAVHLGYKNMKNTKILSAGSKRSVTPVEESKKKKKKRKKRKEISA